MFWLVLVSVVVVFSIFIFSFSMGGGSNSFLSLDFVGVEFMLGEKRKFLENLILEDVKRFCVMGDIFMELVNEVMLIIIDFVVMLGFEMSLFLVNVVWDEIVCLEECCGIIEFYVIGNLLMFKVNWWVLLWFVGL